MFRFGVWVLIRDDLEHGENSYYKVPSTRRLVGARGFGEVGLQGRNRAGPGAIGLAIAWRPGRATGVTPVL